jgi:hypothetical protein
LVTTTQKSSARSAWLIFAVILAAFCPASAARAQSVPGIMLPGDVPPRVKKRKPKPDVLPPIPTRSPSFAIPLGPLGYGAPSPTYLGRHYSLFSLDFLDDNRLLFSLRAPGLLSRESSEATGDRQMKAVALDLPNGTVVSQALWTVPDRGRYLWMLGDGRFLLRDREGLKVGDQSLATKLLLPLTGQFQSLQMSPSGRVAVVHSLESAGSNPIVTRVVQLGTGQVQQTTHSSALAEPPINAVGSLDVSHISKYDQWSLKLTAFSGGTKVLGQVESTCLPSPSFLSEAAILISGCNAARIPKLTALSTNGATLWESEAPLPFVPPLLLTTVSGARFGIESIVLKKKPNPGTETLWVKAVRGQALRVFDSATGKVVLEVSVSPVLDGGGNAAISPSGKRVAILNNGSIQVFDLPAPQGN